MLVNSVNSPITFPMLPSGSQLPTSKRKASSDDSAHPLLAAAKRLKKDKSTIGKRKLLNAEETPSGLIIVRTATNQDASYSASQPLPPSSSYNAPPPRSFSSQPVASSSSQLPPSKKFRASSAQPSSSRYPQPGPDDPELESAVRAMNDEADTLRRQSRIPTVMDQNPNPAFQFSVDNSAPTGGIGPARSKRKGNDILMYTFAPLEQNETPQIERNKRLREGAMAAIASDREADNSPSERVGRTHERGKDHRRRSSVSRGKRISTGFETTGIITSPHNTVSEASFYKHIDLDLPDSERLRQLLIWCTIRASGTTTFSNSSTPSKPKSIPNHQVQLPKLSDKATQVLRRAQDDLVRMLAERKIDLSLYRGLSRGEEGSSEGRTLKENEQNLKNKNFEVTYSQQIRQLEEEEDQWKKVSFRYEEYSKRFSQAMERRVMDATASTAVPMSAKAKGKQRLIDTEEELDEILPDPRDLPSDLRRSLDLARSALLPSASRSTSSSTTRTIPAPTSILTSIRGVKLTDAEVATMINDLLPDVTYKLDRLHSFVNAARTTTRVAEDMLDERFRLLISNLEKRRVGNGIGDSEVEGGTRRSGEGGMEVVKNYVTKEVPPLHARDLTAFSGTPNATHTSAPGGGLIDLMRALSRIDTARHPSKVGDEVRRAQREVKRVQGDISGTTNPGNGVGGGGVEGDSRRRLTAVYPPGILSGVGGGSSVVMTPRKVAGTPRREKTPRRERTPGP